MRLTAGHSEFSAAVVYERRLAAVAFLLILLIAADPFQVILGSEFPAGMVKTALLIPVLASVMLNLSYFMRGIFAVPELALLLLLALISAFWSVDPALTFERAVMMVSLSVLAITLGAMLSLRSLVLAIGGLAAACTIASLVAIALIPEARGSDSWPDTWRGIFNHKNGLGSFSAIALIVLFASAIMTKGGLRQFFYASALMALVLLIASDSRTSQFIAVISFVAFLAAVLYRDYLRAWAIGYVLVVVVLAVIVFSAFATGALGVLFETIGRKPTLSGRIPLWELLWPWITDRIWFGYGYMAFWDPESPRVMEFARDRAVGFAPHYSHNGLLELLLNVGVVGVPLFVGMLVRAFSGLIATCTHPKAQIPAAFSLVYMLMFLLFNITEGSILGRDNPAWIIFVAIVTKFSILLQRRPGRGMSPARTRRRMRFHPRAAYRKAVVR